MRRALAVAVCGLVGTGSPAPAEDSGSGPAARITYVANEGFLVTVGDAGVLVDGLFAPGPLDWADVPSADTRRRLETGAPPFDEVRVALVTHRHVDHFDPGVAVAFLRSRPGADLVGPPQVEERLKATPGFEAVASRVHAVPATPGADTSLTFGDVTVRALGIPHSVYMVKDESTGEMVNRHRNTENLGYWVDVGGFTFFHNGDAGLTAADEYCRFDLPSAGVDVAFLGGVFWGPTEPTLETVRRCLVPGHVVPMHLHPDERTTLAGRIEALDGPHPLFVVPGPPMTEIVLP
jgi:L-ascorbate metabolism protein UlaG (beta-lactamase superfamily)